MHVAIDAVGNVCGGGWSVLVRTVSEIASDPRVGQLTVFTSPLARAPAPAPERPGVRWVEQPDAHRRAGRVAWYLRELDRQTRAAGADVVLTMNTAGQTSLPRLTVVQQAFLTGGLRGVRPAAFAAKLALLRRLAARSITSARGVIVQTSWMRGRVWATWGRDATVLPLGLPRPRPRARRDTGTLVAVVGSALPYKRMDLAHEALRLARRRVPALEMTAITSAPPAAVDTLLDRATMLLHPSEIESLGLPVVEAFAAGCPVVLPRLPWALAVAGDAALYFDSGSASSAARRLVESVQWDGLLDEARVRGDARLAALWRESPYTRLVDLLVEAA